MNTNKINYMHFILSVLVILIHSINNVSFFQKIFSIENGIGQFAVPLFFIISGFLFFRNVHNLDDVYVKIRKRIHTVVVPFLIWNLIYYVLHLLIKPEGVFSLMRLIDVVCNYTYNPAFWFMYQLILLIAISPVIFFGLKDEKSFTILFLIVSLFVVLKLDIPFINEDAIIYFLCGGYFSKLINSNTVYLIDKKNCIYMFISSIILYIINRLCYKLCALNISCIPVFTLSVIYVRVSVAFLIFYICDLFFKYNKLPEFMKYTFFLYAIHYAIVRAIIKLVLIITFRLNNLQINYIIENAAFVMSPIICIVINYYLSRILIKKVPKIFYLITGDRK